ncbi:MAG: class II glutamine amidotransferase [Armatimonadetes bacterium]|nr:class II glutamine amidotransferase [Armatimonadota bacterium]
MRTLVVAMSFDAAASPVVRFRQLPRSVVPGRVPCGWGFGWYPEGDSAVAVVKDPHSSGDGPLVRMLQDWSHFRSTLFISFALGAARRRSQQDTHPFQLRYGGRDWLLTHNGTLRGFRQSLGLGDPLHFQPVGRTDSEHALCWIAGRLRSCGARSLHACGWPELHGLLREINGLGTANLVLTDGTDLVVYHDQDGFNEIYWTRRLPVEASHQIDLGLLDLDLSDAAERNRTAVLFSTRPAAQESWARMVPGQMLVVRRGHLTWDSLLGGRPPVRKDGSPVAAQPSGTAPPAPGERVVPVATDAAVRDAPYEQTPLRAAAATLPVLRTVHAEPERARRYRVVHETSYRYSDPVERSSHLLRLIPIHDPFQHVIDHALEVTVEGAHRDFEDVFGNRTTLIEVDTPFSEMRVVSRSLVEVLADAQDAFEAADHRLLLPLVWMPWQRQMMTPYLLPPELPESQLRELSEFAMAAVERCDYDVLDTLIDLNETIYQDFEYVPRSTTLATTPYQVFCARRGVCQDFANVLICLARLLAVPARYRAGYIYTGVDYENQLQSEATHAWVELYLPWIGWRGFDPTNGRMVGPDHIRVACGRTYQDATPTSGTIFRGGGDEVLSVNVKVEQVS